MLDFRNYLKGRTGAVRANYIMARLRTILNSAAEEGLISVSPTRKLGSIKTKKPKINPFDADEITTILEGAGKGWERSLLTLLFGTGMRPGEALALQWDDINLDRRTVDVSKTVYRGVIGPTKTLESSRTIPLDAIVLGALKKLSAPRFKKGLVFPSKRNTPLDLGNFGVNFWHPLLKRLGLKSRGIYQTRPTFACVSLDNGATPLQVSRTLGHVSVAMVIENYASTRHATTGDRAPAVAAFARAFARTAS